MTIQKGNWWEHKAKPRNSLQKATTVFKDLYRGGKATLKWSSFGLKASPPSGGRIAITSTQLTVTRGQNSTIMECSVDRSVGNTGNAMVGFKVNGFILLSVVYNGNKHVKWFMLSERPQNNKIEMKECTAVQSAMLSRISREQHHTMVHIGSENGWEHHALVPRSTKTVTKATPLPTKGTWSESIVKERLSCQGVTFEKIGDAGKHGATKGDMTKSLVPCFSRAVIDVPRRTAFRIEKDENRVFNLPRGRWIVGDIEGSPRLSSIEIYSEESGSVHRAKVSVGSATSARVTSAKNRPKNASVFRRI